MDQLDDERFIRRAIQIADLAMTHGNQPFGALLVKDGEIIIEAESTKVNTKDCTRHAELTVAALASMILDKETLSKCTLYSSTEPCAMCTGAIYWSGIGRVVFGCSNEALCNLKGDKFQLKCRDVLAHGTRKVHVIGPVLEAEAILSHNKFWKSPQS